MPPISSTDASEKQLSWPGNYFKVSGMIQFLVSTQALWGIALITLALFFPDSVKCAPPTLTKLYTQTGDFGDGKLLLAKASELFFFGTHHGYLFVRDVLKNEPVNLTRKISANWISAAIDPIDSSRAYLVCSSFQEKSVRLYMIDLKLGQATLISTLSDDTELRIDPAINYINSGWIATFTSVVTGAGDRKMYAVHFLRTEDLYTWKEIGKPIVREHNVEDVRIFTGGREISLLYEDESSDLGSSSLCMIESTDLGEHWSSEKIILNDGSDNEPGGIVKSSGRIEYFFSSDRNQKGSAYRGSQIFRLQPNATIATPNMSEKIQLVTEEKPLLLVDAAASDTHYFFAALKNYNHPTASLLIASIPLGNL